MSQPNTLRTVIVAAVEPSAASDQVIHTASSLAGIVPGAELHLVYVVDPGPPPHAMALSITDLVSDGRVYLDRAVERALAVTAAKVVGHLGIGAPAERILQIATDIDADLVVVGTHEKKGLGRMLGSVSNKVLLNARCPVLVARVKETEPAGPEIEPPCPDCVNVQFATRGEKLWCERHATRHVHGRVHYALAKGYGAGAMFLRPSA
ncbi:MAG: universal stress protein [Labilithrix sp.]|nr:universal stress protein [Labilithrix sp.]MCW5812548.1 universal stress protein [Labilithrix sp.]